MKSRRSKKGSDGLAKHNDKEFQEKLKAKFREGYENEFKRGLAKGAYAVCKVVYDRATDETKTPDERLNIIKEFCATLAKGKEPGDTDKPDKSA